MVDIPNIFGAGMAAYDDQTKRLNAADQLRASKQAGAAIASGDYTEGANVFNRAGMVDQGHNVLADQTVLQDRQTKAANAAEDRQRTLALQKIDAFGKLADVAGTLPEGQRLTWIQQHAQDLATLGLPPDRLSAMTEADLSNQSLSAFKAALGKEAKKYTLAQGSKLVDDKGVEIARGDPKPQEYLVLPPGGKAVPKPTTGATVDNLPPPAADPVAAPAGDPGAAIDSFAKGGGAVVTSGLRTPEHNAEVGGVPNSHHLTGQARDLIPPPGATIAELAAEMQRRLPGAKVIQEKDHVHVQWNGPQAAAPAQSAAHAGDPPGTLYGNAKDEPAPSGYRWVGGNLQAIPGGPADNGDDVPLSPSAISLQAGMMLKTGVMPSLGMGKAARGDRVKILNEVDRIAKSIGLSADDIVAGTASMKAATKGLNNATTLRAAVEGSEATVLKNGQAALALAERAAGPTQAPVLNRWIQAGRKNIAGDPQVAAFDLAVNTVATEYAKVMTTATGTGGTATSDSARREAERLINSAQTPAQLRAVISQMKIEMDNRAQSLRDVEVGLRNQVRSSNSSGGPTPAASTSAPAPAPSSSGGGWGKAVVVRH